MDGKVVVVTGALGALGRVVVDEALARGARIASVDHAPTQAPATADLFELGGVDLTDAAHANGESCVQQNAGPATLSAGAFADFRCLCASCTLTFLGECFRAGRRGSIRGLGNAARPSL
jgi:NAD(P)-dependent dehydrogenase (short-subunit alcohol dehydrogenase family)